MKARFFGGGFVITRKGEDENWLFWTNSFQGSGDKKREEAFSLKRETFTLLSQTHFKLNYGFTCLKQALQKGT